MRPGRIALCCAHDRYVHAGRCPLHHALLSLLPDGQAASDQEGVAFREIDVSGNPTLRREMSAKASGRTSVPQIWIGDTHVGGCNELYALERNGRLDPLLAAAPR